MSFGAAMRVVRETKFAGISPAARGKVRDIYDAGDKLLIVATDRLSAFDVILPTPIPDKGRVLTQLSLFWFDLLRDVIPNHVLNATEFPAPFEAFREKLGVTIPQLSDFEPKGVAARAFGAYFEPAGMTARALVVTDPEGIVRWSYLAENPGVLPGANLLFDGLAAVDAATA